jgi:hypothetical protein
MSQKGRSLREGYTLLAARLERLPRSTRDLLNTPAKIVERGAIAGFGRDQSQHANTTP